MLSCRWMPCGRCSGEIEGGLAALRCTLARYEAFAAGQLTPLRLAPLFPLCRHLDPITLARSACVCREWQAAAEDDGLWRLHCERLHGRPAAVAVTATGARAGTAAVVASAERPGEPSAGTALQSAAASSAQQAAGTGSNSASCRQQFAAAVRQRPERLLRWRTNRIVLAGRKLGWLDPQQPPAGSWRHVSTAAVLAFLRSGGRRLRAGGSDTSSSGGGSSSSGSEDEEGTSRRLRFWQL